MDVTFYQFGVEYLRWLDKDGNIWTAVKEQVEFFGKDFFESMPEDENVSWEVVNADDIAEPGIDEDGNDYIDEYLKEHPDYSGLPFPEVI